MLSIFDSTAEEVPMSNVIGFQKEAFKKKANPDGSTEWDIETVRYCMNRHTHLNHRAEVDSLPPYFCFVWKGNSGGNGFSYNKPIKFYEVRPISFYFANKFIIMNITANIQSST